MQYDLWDVYNKMNISSALYVLMAWCFRSQSAEYATMSFQNLSVMAETHIASFYLIMHTIRNSYGFVCDLVFMAFAFILNITPWLPGPSHTFKQPQMHWVHGSNVSLRIDIINDIPYSLSSYNLKYVCIILHLRANGFTWLWLPDVSCCMYIVAIVICIVLCYFPIQE